MRPLKNKSKYERGSTHHKDRIKIMERMGMSPKEIDEYFKEYARRNKERKAMLDRGGENIVALINRFTKHLEI
jgi:hypothetical protein